MLQGGALPAASRQQVRYTKPELVDQMDLTHSLSFGLDNENGFSEKSM